MSKNMRYLLLILVLIVPLALAACGGDDDDGGSDSSVKLDQTYESPSGISFKYPEGWVVQDDGGQVILATSADGLESMQAEGSGDQAPPKGEAGFVVMALPLADLGMPEDTTVDTIFDMMVGSMTGEGMAADGDVKELKIGDNDARQQNVKDSASDSDGFIIAFMDGSDAFVMLIGVTAPGERGDFEATGVKIAETIEYTAPAAG